MYITIPYLEFLLKNNSYCGINEVNPLISYEVLNGQKRPYESLIISIVIWSSRSIHAVSSISDLKNNNLSSEDVLVQEEIVYTSLILYFA